MCDAAARKRRYGAAHHIYKSEKAALQDNPKQHWEAFFDDSYNVLKATKYLDSQASSCSPECHQSRRPVQKGNRHGRRRDRTETAPGVLPESAAMRAGRGTSYVQLTELRVDCQTRGKGSHLLSEHRQGVRKRQSTRQGGQSCGRSWVTRSRSCSRARSREERYRRRERSQRLCRCRSRSGRTTPSQTTTGQSHSFPRWARRSSRWWQRG